MWPLFPSYSDCVGPGGGDLHSYLTGMIPQHVGGSARYHGTRRLVVAVQSIFKWEKYSLTGFLKFTRTHAPVMH